MFFNFFIIYVFLGILGIGFTRYLTTRSVQVALAPILGFCLISTIGVYFLAFGIHRIYLIYSIFGLIVVSILLELNFLRKNRYHTRNIPYLAIFLIAFISMRLNNYSHGSVYFSINPDVAGYIFTAEWLTHLDRTLTQLTYPMSPYAFEILHNTFRWSLSNFLSISSVIFHQQPAAYIFPVGIIILFSSVWSCVALFNERFNVFNSFSSQLVISAICINAGILYLLYEGFYPNIIGFGLLSILLILTLQNEDHQKTIILASLLISAIIPTYSEVYILYGLCIGCMILFNLLYRKEFLSKENQLLILPLLFSLLLAFPISFKIIQFSFANIQNMRNIGYPQPAWMFPSDIVGLSTLYQHFKDYINVEPHLIHRSFLYTCLCTILSLWLIIELFKQRNILLLVTSIFITLSIFIYNYFILHVSTINYLYDKIAILFSVVFVCCFYKSLVEEKAFVKLIIAILCVLTSTGLFLSKDNLQYRSFVNINELKEVAALQDGANDLFLTNERAYRKGTKLMQLQYVDRAHDIFLEAYSNRLLDQYDPRSCTNQQREHSNILLLVRKSDLANKIAVKEQYKKSIIHETRHYLVINTHKQMNYICPNGEFKPEKLFILN